MVAPYRNKKLRFLDVGCGPGLLARLLSDSFDVVGVEIEKAWLSRRCDKRACFVVGAVENLPFTKGSFDLILCTSVLEHIRLIDDARRSLKSLLSEKGVLIVGYPVETWLFKFIWRIVSPHEFKYIDQNHPENVKDYWNKPGTHKQTYQSIRRVLNKHFRRCRVVKLPFTLLPSLFAYYECAVLKAC